MVGLDGDRTRPMSIRVIRTSDCRTMPWKNGGGMTVEIAVGPDGAAFGDFDWRISSALVSQSGPFSALPGIDRTLCIISDGAIDLSIADADPVSLDRSSPPYRFSGDAVAHALLLDRAVRDLNIMTRRTTCRHMVEDFEFTQIQFVPVAADLAALFLVEGEIRVTTRGGDVATLTQGDTLLADGAAGGLDLAAMPGVRDGVRAILARIFGVGATLPVDGLESAFPKACFAR
jgi:environmental stress-induced protein Ves